MTTIATKDQGSGSQQRGAFVIVVVVVCVAAVVVVVVARALVNVAYNKHAVCVVS